MNAVSLPPELEQFAAEAVATGRYRDTADVMRAAVDLLKRQELARANFIASLEAAEAESEREGWLTAEEVHAEMTALINEAQRRDKTRHTHPPGTP